MRLSPREIDKLALHAAGSLAQKRLARGLRLNHPEAVALIASVLLELIRDGRDGENLGVAALMDAGRRMLGKRHVLPSVVGILHEVQVEGTFIDGTKLVTVHDPIATDDGDLALALYGSFLPVPKKDAFPSLPGEDDADGAKGTKKRKKADGDGDGDRPKTNGEIVREQWNDVAAAAGCDGAPGDVVASRRRRAGRPTEREPPSRRTHGDEHRRPPNPGRDRTTTSRRRTVCCASIEASLVYDSTSPPVPRFGSNRVRQRSAAGAYCR